MRGLGGCLETSVAAMSRQLAEMPRNFRVSSCFLWPAKLERRVACFPATKRHRKTQKMRRSVRLHGLRGCLGTSISAMCGQHAEMPCDFLCLFVFFVAGETQAARGLFFSHKETQEDTKKCEERAGRLCNDSAKAVPPTIDSLVQVEEQQPIKPSEMGGTICD